MDTVTFIYKGQETFIQCINSEQMKIIFKRFINKVGVNINNIFFIYDGMKINEEITFNQLANENDKKEHKIKVLVYDMENANIKEIFNKAKDIICPKCNDDNIFININNYRIFLSGCKNGHMMNDLLLDNFLISQKIDLSKIICNECYQTNKSETYNNEFFRCNKCNKNLCPLCKSNHNKNHKIIKYEEKNYFCLIHNCPYIKYCNQCKKNTCIQCEKNHKNHDIIYLGDILPDKEELVNKQKELKENLSKMFKEIDNIINILKKVKDNLEKYYNLSDEIINNYEMEYINYYLLKNINEFNDFNKIIIKDINEIINSNSLFKKVNNMINIYNKMNNINSESQINLYNPVNKSEIMIKNYKFNNYINLNSEATTLILLKNKKDIAVCMANGFIEIYDVLFFRLKLSSEIINNTTILDIIEFKDNIFFISCYDYKIRIIMLYDNNTKVKILQILEGHKNYINSLRKILYYRNEIVIASSASDGKIIFWKYNQENFFFNKFKEIRIYLEEPSCKIPFQLESLEESIKYHQLMCGHSLLKKIYFCNLNNLSQIENMEISVNRCIRALKIIDDDVLLVAGNQEIYIVDIGKKSIISSIKYYYVNCEFNCIFIKQNGNILITEYGDICKIKEFKFDKIKKHLNLISIREKDFSKYITTIAELDNETLIVGGYDKIIKIFEK